MATKDLVLVTGAFGNIGRNVLAWLLERGRPVRALSDAWRHDRRIARELSGKLDVVEGDIRDESTVDRALSGVSHVIHLAYVIPPAALARPAYAESVNVGGTRTLLTSALQQPQPPRVLFASTLDVYGHTTHLAPPRHVSDPLQATDAYSSHKILCERMVRESGLEWCILRFADVPPIEVRLPHPIMFRIPLETRIEVIHPRDAALAIGNALDTPSVWGRILNVGGGASCQVTYGEYLTAFLDAMGIGALPREAFSTEPYCTDWLDTDESQRLLRYQRFGFRDIVRETEAVLGWRRPLAQIARPLVRRAILALSPAWRRRPRGRAPAR